MDKNIQFTLHLGSLSENEDQTVLNFSPAPNSPGDNASVSGGLPVNTTSDFAAAAGIQAGKNYRVTIVEIELPASPATEAAPQASTEGSTTQE